MNTLKAYEMWPSALALHNTSGEYRNALAIVEIWLVFAVSSAEPERGFSLMGRIKSDWRSVLSNDSLNDLMIVRLSNKNIKSYNVSRAVSLWWSKTARRLTAPHGPHKMKKSNERSSDSESE